MTSEIKVDTISEQTSANGVTIDGLTIKDGNIIGDVALARTTPTFTIGDAGAEDAALIFDGNAVDYYMALDDSADNLIIGSGSTVGSNSLITIDSDGDTTFDIVGGITLDADDEGTISFKDGGSRYGLVKKASDNFEIQSMLSDGDIVFKGNDGGSTITALTLDMSAAGNATFNADVTVGGTLNASGTQIITSNTPVISFIESDQSNKQYQIGSFGAAFAVYDASNTEFRYIIDTNGNHIFNEGSADVDFRVESNGNANMLFVDGGENRVGFGTGTPGRDYQFLTTDQTDVSIIAANNQYAQLLFGDPDDDNIGSIGYNNSSNAMEFHANATQIFTIHSDGVVFNEASNDQNFRIESNGNTHKFMVNAGNNLVGINADPDLGSGLHIKNADSGASANANADELVLENSGDAGLSILS